MKIFLFLTIGIILAALLINHMNQTETGGISEGPSVTQAASVKAELAK